MNLNARLAFFFVMIALGAVLSSGQALGWSTVHNSTGSFSLGPNNNGNLSQNISSGSGFNITFSDPETNTTTPSSSSSSTGGNPSTSAEVSQTWTALSTGTTATMKITSTAIDLTEVAFKVAEAAANVKLTVQKLSSKPSDVSSAPKGTVYQYVSISKENITDSKISSAVISFKVNASWLSLNNLDSATVTLNRYTGGQWVALSTSKSSEDSAYIYYTAQSSGFSYFAISAEKKGGAEAPKTPTPPADKVNKDNGTAAVNPPPRLDNNTPSPPPSPPPPVSLYLIAAIITVLLIVGALLYFGKVKAKPSFKYGYKR